jgi:small subunit ribosomal protein S16
MLNIRLSRVGKKGHAQYKVVVAEKTSPVKGKFVEQVGSYDPHTKELIAKKDRIEYWIGNGAACSDTVKNLFIEKGIIEGDKVKLTFKKKKGEEDEAEGEKKAEVKTDESKDAKKGEDTKTEDAAEDKKDEKDSSEKGEK